MNRLDKLEWLRETVASYVEYWGVCGDAEEDELACYNPHCTYCIMAKVLNAVDRDSGE